MDFCSKYSIPTRQSIATPFSHLNIFRLKNVLAVPLKRSGTPIAVTIKEKHVELNTNDREGLRTLK